MYSCFSGIENGSYGESFGVIHELDDGTIYMVSDENETLIPNENISSTVKPGDRAWMSYVAEPAEQNTVKVTPYRVISIALLNLHQNIDFHDDGLDLWEVWIAQNFLTFDFRIRAKDQNEMKNHEYALILQSDANDTLSIRIIHDAKGDTKEGISCRTAVALRMSEIAGKKFSTIAIEYQDYVDKTMHTVYRNVNSNNN